MAKKRIMGLALAIIALGLTVTGVVIAATDSNPGRPHQRPPGAPRLPALVCGPGGDGVNGGERECHGDDEREL